MQCPGADYRRLGIYLLRRITWILSLDTGVPLSKRVGREDVLKSQPQALIYSQFDINYESFLAYLLLIIANEIFGMKNKFCFTFY